MIIGLLDYLKLVITTLPMSPSIGLSPPEKKVCVNVNINVYVTSKGKLGQRLSDYYSDLHS